MLDTIMHATRTIEVEVSNQPWHMTKAPGRGLQNLTLFRTRKGKASRGGQKASLPAWYSSFMLNSLFKKTDVQSSLFKL